MHKVPIFVEDLKRFAGIVGPQLPHGCDGVVVIDHGAEVHLS
jgi:hypothetical protein